MRRRISYVLLLSIACACGPAFPGADSSHVTRTPSADSAAIVRGLLLDEIHREVERWISPRPSPLPADSVEFTTEQSRVVPGLVYHWAQYAPEYSTHFSLRAVVAERGTRREVIRDAADWGLASAGWYSETPATAVRACRELIAVVAAKTPPPKGGRMDDTTTLARFIGSDPLDQYTTRLKRRVATEPNVSKATDHPVTRVELWVLEQARLLPTAHYYRCELPRDSTAMPGFTLVEELRGE